MKFSVLKDFSEQNLIDCDSNKQGRGTSLTNYGCTGGWPEAAFDYIKYYGIVEDMYYPYRNSVSKNKYDQRNSLQITLFYFY